MQIMQGDAYSILITLKDDENHDITSGEVMGTLGTLSKSLEYDSSWVFPLSQEETFAMSGALPLRVRVKFPDGTVAGATVGTLFVLPSANKEVL